MIHDIPSMKQIKQMAGKGGKFHSESSKMGSSMKCENGKCERTVCRDGKCTKQLMAAPGAGAQGANAGEPR